MLTNSGYKPMLEIQLTDLLWDGCDWVPHQGLLHKGEKETWTHNGLTATADHKVLVGDTWREWQEVLTNPSLFRQALFSATSPVLNGDNANLPAGTVSMPLGCDVPVGMRGSQTKECFYPEKPNSAGIAKIAPQNPRSGTALKNHSRSVLASVWGSLPVLSGRVEARPFNRLCVARAAGRGLLPDIVYSEAPQRGAIAALKEKLWRHVGNRKATTQFAQIGTTVTDCWTGLVQSLLGARTQTVQRIQITAGAVSQSILSGWEIASRFFATLWDCKAGTSPSYNWTASTTTEGMSRETCDLSHAASTWPTSEKSLHEKSWNFNAGLNPLKQRMQTYDIAFAGPRNRYTVLTSNGPIIVHNCGYGLGWASFSTQLLTGFLGAPPIRYDKTIAKKLGVTSDYIERFIDWEENILRMQEIPHTCSTKDLLIHCIAAKKIIELYRAAAHPVAGFWKLCESLIQRSLADGEEYRHKCLVFRKEEIVLPNGMSLRYPNIRQQKDARGRPRWVYGPDATSIYGEKVTNNVTQGVARVVMTDGMLRTAKRYPVAGTVHDEQIIVVPASESKEALAWMLEQMTLEPSYMPGIPLAAEGGVHRRYGLAKK